MTAGLLWVLDDNGKTVRTAVLGNSEISYSGHYPKAPASWDTYELREATPTWTAQQLEAAFAVGSLPTVAPKVDDGSGGNSRALEYTWPAPASGRASTLDTGPHATVGYGVDRLTFTGAAANPGTLTDAPAQHATAEVAARRVLTALGVQDGVRIGTVNAAKELNGAIVVSLAPSLGEGALTHPFPALSGTLRLVDGNVTDASISPYQAGKGAPVRPLDSRESFAAFRRDTATLNIDDARGRYERAELVNAACIPSRPGQLRVIPAWQFVRTDGTVLTVSADPTVDPKHAWVLGERAYPFSCG